MPRIPTYEGPQVRTEALRPSFQRTPDVSSGTTALANALTTGAQILDRRIERDAQDEAFKLELQVRSDYQSQRAALREQYKGDQADQYSAAMADWWKKAPDQYGKSASPMARQIANKALGQLALQSQADTLGYVESEKTKAREINFRTLQNQIISDAGSTVNAGNAQALAATTRQQILDNAIRHATLMGAKDPAATGKLMADELLGKYHADVAVALASKPGGAEAAKSYLLQHGSAIPLDVRTRVDQAVQGELENQTATREAARVASLPFDQQLTTIAKIENTNVREKALQRVRENQAMVMAAQQERERKASDQAWQLVGQGKTVPEALLAQMDGKERVSLHEHLREKAKRDAAGIPVKTDWATYVEARDRIVKLATEGKTLTSGEWAVLAGKIAPTQMDDLAKMAVPAGKTGTASSGAQDAMFTDAQRIDNALVAAGIDKKRDPEGAGMFQSEVDRRVRAASAERGGKNLTADEKQKIIDEVLLDRVYVERIGPDKETLLSLVPRADIDAKKVYVNVDGREVNLSQIPGDYSADARRRRRAAGLPITEAYIAKMWVADGRPTSLKAAQGVSAAPAPRSSATPASAAPATVGTIVRPPAAQPSIYASQEEWAAYRAQQAAAAAAPAPAAPAPAAPTPAPAAPAPAPATPTPAPATPTPAAPAPATRAPAPAPAPATPAPAARAPAAPAPAQRAPAAPAPAPRAPAPAPAAPAPARVASTNIAGVDELRDVLQKTPGGANKSALNTLQSQISMVRRNIENMRVAEKMQLDANDQNGARITRTEILKAEALVIQARDKLREERRRPLEAELQTARDLVNKAQRDLEIARTDADRNKFGKALAERQAEAQRLERELQAVLKF